MAKVLVVGSRKGYDQAAFHDACSKIGIALANAGHTIVTAGCGKDDAETGVLDGANSVRSLKRKTEVIPYAPAVPGTCDLLIDTPGVAGRWSNLLFLPALTTKGEWAVGQAVALTRCDVALLIGGGVLTANVGSLALEIDKPYFAVEMLGGAAEKVAQDDHAKHIAMGLPVTSRQPNPADPEFGKRVVQGCEFVVRQTKQKSDLRRSLILLSVSWIFLVAFLAAIFHDNLFSKDAQLLYTTSFGALAGVILSLLIGNVIRREPIQVSDVIGQAALASYLGVLYGFFVLEAGQFYGVEIKSLTDEALRSVAKNMGFVGLGVGALLAPASKRILGELGQFSKLKGD